MSEALCRASMRHGGRDPDGGAPRRAIRNVEFINGRTRLVRCVVDNISLDITARSHNAIAAAVVLQEADDLLCSAGLAHASRARPPRGRPDAAAASPPRPPPTAAAGPPPRPPRRRAAAPAQALDPARQGVVPPRGRALRRRRGRARAAWRSAPRTIVGLSSYALSVLVVALFGRGGALAAHRAAAAAAAALRGRRGGGERRRAEHTRMPSSVRSSARTRALTLSASS